MTQCKECGYMYNDNINACPKCGNPSHLSIHTNTCPGCGAELTKVQGYNFVCEFCGTATPVDPQTRAKIDAKRRQEINAQITAQQIENNRIAEKQLKKGCLIAVIIIATIIALGAVIDKCQSDKWHEKEHEQRIADAARNNRNTPEEIASVSLNDFYFSANDIFSNSGKDGIGHLKQDLKSLLSQKGFVEEGTEQMSYYGNNNETGVPIISVKFNTYFPQYSHCDRKNETDDIHSLTIEIGDDGLYNDFKAKFIKELRSIGFAKEYAAGRGYESSIEMIGKDFLRIGNVASKEEGYLTKTYCNWEAVDLEDYKGQIVCIAFTEL